MPEPARLGRHQQRLEELAGASIRALTGQRDLAYRRYVLHHGERAVHAVAPHLRVPPAQRDMRSLRGIADAQALRWCYSDDDRFRAALPEDAVQRLVFDVLEQFRCETLVPDHLPGVRANVQDRFLAWTRSFHESGLADTELGLLLYTVFVMAWARLNALPAPHHSDETIEATRAGLGAHIGHLLADMRRHRQDQAAFAPPALELARFVGSSVQQLQEKRGEDGKDDVAAMTAFALLVEPPAEGAGQVAAAATGHSRVFQETGSRYRVFTRQFDVELEAGSQVRAAALQAYRQELDGLVAAQAVNRWRLARTLTAALAEPSPDGLLDGQEEGWIDGRRLARLVSAPAQRDVFVRNRLLPRVPCAITFLLDCSGSMKVWSRPLAVLVDILVRALERLGAQTEVLGFTTSAWNGGRAQRAWMQAGRPPWPGRLNEVCHRVFKPADSRWRRARHGIAALFRDDLFREGIDGEAVLWAARRLHAIEARRRILVVISDGCPMDTATLRSNDEFYLDNHLRQAVQDVQAGGLEVVGVGVGLDLSPFYRRSQAVDLGEGLTNETVYEVARLLHRPRR